MSGQGGNPQNDPGGKGSSGADGRGDSPLVDNVALEKAKLRFEFFKHLATLDVATAVIILALYRDSPVNPFADPSLVALALAAALLALGASLITCLAGMHMLISMLDLPAEAPSEREQLERTASRLEKLRSHAGAAFFGGVGSFALTAIGFL